MPSMLDGMLDGMPSMPVLHRRQVGGGAHTSNAQKGMAQVSVAGGVAWRRAKPCARAALRTMRPFSRALQLLRASMTLVLHMVRLPLPDMFL